MYGLLGRAHQQLEDPPPVPGRLIASVPFLDTKCSQLCEPTASDLHEISPDEPDCRTEDEVHQDHCGVNNLIASDGDSGMSTLSTVLLLDRITNICREGMICAQAIATIVRHALQFFHVGSA